MLLCALLGAAAAHAAGGHHGVDDAGILEPGQCEAESWLARSQGRGHLLHAGLACRAGPVELTVDGEVARAGAPSQATWDAQVKWATALTPTFNAGMAVTPVWVNHTQPRYQGATVSALFTWSATDSLALHLNFGRDLLRGAPGQPRSGVSAEWTAKAGWSLTGERYQEDGTHFMRAEVGVPLGEWTVEISRVQRLRGPVPSHWMFGLVRPFDRR